MYHYLLEMYDNIRRSDDYPVDNTVKVLTEINSFKDETQLAIGVQEILNAKRHDV